VVLSLPDPEQSKMVSRWHFELRRNPAGLILRSVTDQTTEVDGRPLPKGAEIPIKPGSTVKLAKVMTLEFLGDSSLRPPEDAGSATKHMP
jgi:predicted component of type VI protein secretion system